MEDEENEGQFLERLKTVADKYKIKIWKMTPSELNK
jgi:hypothetical protein